MHLEWWSGALARLRDQNHEKSAKISELRALLNKRDAQLAEALTEISGLKRRLEIEERAVEVYAKHHAELFKTLYVGAADAHAQDALAALPPKFEDTRPAQCRERLRDEGKPYLRRRACFACGLSAFHPCPHSQPQTAADVPVKRGWNNP